MDRLWNGSYSTPPPQPVPTPLVAVIYTCNGRGFEHHSDDDVETRAIAQTMPTVPFAGFFAGGEIGPAGSGSFDKASDEFIPRVMAHQFSCVVATLGAVTPP